MPITSVVSTMNKALGSAVIFALFSSDRIIKRGSPFDFSHGELFCVPDGDG